MKGTGIREQRCSFYLYKIASVWDREKGRARKVTGKYLGKITPDGLVKPKSEMVLDELEGITVREYGASAFMLTSCSDAFEKSYNKLNSCSTGRLLWISHYPKKRRFFKKTYMNSCDPN